MKKPITVRIDADLLELVRVRARQENRKVTNFIETALREKVGFPAIGAKPERASQSMSPQGPSDVG